MKNFRLFIYTIVILLFSSPLIGSQFSFRVTEGKLVFQDDSTYVFTSISDTPIVTTRVDTLFTDSITSDSIFTDSIPRKKDALDAPVDYEANDSIVYDFTDGNKGYLYGESKVNYQNIGLKSEYITMNLDSSIVNATFGLDSIGEEFGYPVFTDGGSSGGTDYEAKMMRYNFKSKKGFINHVITEQGEGYIVADKAKKNADDSFFMRDGIYTTCDHHDHPHFYLKLTKAKVRPKKDVITGPAYLVIEDVPIYFLGLPFAFFPFTDKYSSGVIMPSYDDVMDRGFGLRDGGYYFAINDYVDLALTGEIYTKGSWGLNARSTYRKRYRYTGNFNASYRLTKYGEKGDPDYSTYKDISLSWSHSQDPKANMYRTLSASVNFSTSTYNRNDVINRYTDSGTSDTKNSTVTLTQRFPNSPFTLSANMSAAQISRDSTIALTLPNLTVSMSRIYPFKRKEAVGKERWYEKIQLSYTGDLRNSITTKENLLLKSNIQKDWRNAMKHTIPVSATFNIFNYLNITPSFNYNERWYTQRINQRWDANQRRAVNADTTYSFNRIYDFNYALSFQTKLYGFFEPIFNIPIFKAGKLDRIRHVFTPSISFSGQPDFSDPQWGFYEKIKYYDADGNEQEYVYSPYSQGIFGTAPSGKQGAINFSFDNNLEMKVKTDNDSTRIISLIDNLGIRFSYNMMADSMRWSDISTNMRLKLSKSLTVNVNATFDPYMYDPIYDFRKEDGKNIRYVKSLNRVDRLRISNGKGFGRLRSTGYSVSTSINQDTFKKWFGKGDKSGDSGEEVPSSEPSDDENELNQSEIEAEKGSLFNRNKKDTNEYDDDGYTRNQVKWNLSFNYSFSYAYSNEIDQMNFEYKRKLTHNFGLSGSIQPTKNWNFSFNTYYDFDASKFTRVSCSLTRNLHCWSISASFIPVGQYQSYFVSLRASSQLLQDLKYEQRGQTSSMNPEWY